MKILMPILLTICMLLQGCVTTSQNAKKGDNYLTNKDYIKAIQSYELSLAESRSTSSQDAIEQKIVSTKVSLTDEYLKRANTVYAGESNKTVPLVNEAAALLENVLRWDDHQHRLKKQIGEYSRVREELLGNIRINLKRASRDAENYNYAGAIELTEQALLIDPPSSNLQKIRKEMMLRKNLFDNINNYLSQGDIDQAVDAYHRLSAATPDISPFSTFPLKKLFVPLLLQKSSILTRQNKWFDAYNLLSQWKLDELNKKIIQIKTKGSKFYYNKTESSIETHSDYFKGYIYALKANELDSKNTKIFQVHKKAQDRVDKSLQKYIAIASFGSPSNEPDAGRQFSDSLISYLYRVLPYGINILERDKIDYVIREHQRETKSIGEILGIDLMVTGSVSLFKVDRTEDKRTATIKFKIGKDTIDNPEFLQMINLYGADTSKWPNIPARTIQKDKYQLLNYSKGTAGIKGFAKVSIRIFDAKKGTITFVKDFDASVVESCEFQDEVKEADIPYIPKNLPTDTEIKEVMRKKIVSEIAKVVQASFENRELRYLNLARFFLDRREYKNAMKPLAEGYLYCILDNIDPDNATFKNIKGLSFELTE